MIIQKVAEYKLKLAFMPASAVITFRMKDQEKRMKSSV